MKSTASRLAVSVIIPVYNGARHLEAAIASVLAQDALPAEIIVMDDGSTDESSAIAAAALSAAPAAVSTRVLTQDNAGQSAARNAAAMVATGDLLAFLDQDDGWYSDHLRR